MTLQEAVNQFGIRKATPVNVDPYNDNGVRKYGRVLSDYEIQVPGYKASFIEPQVNSGDTALWNGETVTVVYQLNQDEPLILKPTVLGIPE
jgi:hypothetical protein